MKARLKFTLALKTVLVQVALHAGLLCGLLTCAIGISHLVSQDLEACENRVQSCVSRALHWNKKEEGNYFCFDSNTRWRNYFSFQPDIFFRHWTPLATGTFSLLSLGVKSWNLNWFQFCIWHIFLALFGNLGYGGNLGIIVGFLSLFVGCLSGIAFFFGVDEPVHIPIQVTKLAPCVRNPNKGVCAYFVYLTHSVAIVSSILTISCGFVVLIERFPIACALKNRDESDREAGLYTCIGPSLIWATESDFFLGYNNAFDGWTTVFTLSPDMFFDTWTPLLLGFVTLASYLGYHFENLTATWSRITIWYLCLALFSNFGYAGNLGIISGFFSMSASVFSFCTLLTGAKCQKSFFLLTSQIRRSSFHVSNDFKTSNDSAYVSTSLSTQKLKMNRT